MQIPQINNVCSCARLNAQMNIFSNMLCHNIRVMLPQISYYGSDIRGSVPKKHLCKEASGPICFLAITRCQSFISRKSLLAGERPWQGVICSANCMRNCAIISSNPYCLTLFYLAVQYYIEWHLSAKLRPYTYFATGYQASVVMVPIR